MSNDLLTQAALLQKESDEVLKNLGLLNYLKQFAEPNITGSVRTGLMTWRDIDMSLIMEPREEVLWDIARYLFPKEGVRSVWVADYRNRPDSPFPKGLYVGAKYTASDGNKWKLDLWLKPTRLDIDATDALMKRLSDENRLIILEIKSQVADHPKYRKDFFSTDIYDAVLDHRVTDLEGFKTYLSSTNRSL